MEQNTPNRPLHTTTKTQEAERMSKLDDREDCHEMLISVCVLCVGFRVLRAKEGRSQRRCQQDVEVTSHDPRGKA